MTNLVLSQSFVHIFVLYFLGTILDSDSRKMVKDIQK
jgi:hypothetical protein